MFHEYDLTETNTSISSIELLNMAVAGSFYIWLYTL